MKIKSMVIAIILLNPIISHGMDGNGFMSICNPPRPDNDYGYACQGYVQATIDLIYSAQGAIKKLPQEIQNSIPMDKRVCLPQIEINQAKLIGIKWHQMVSKSS